MSGATSSQPDDARASEIKVWRLPASNGLAGVLAAAVSTTKPKSRVGAIQLRCTKSFHVAGLGGREDGADALVRRPGRDLMLARLHASVRQRPRDARSTPRIGIWRTP